jgi:peptidoglycan/xylan/chitin deacetylase (PgdA/CDA1 family)
VSFALLAATLLVGLMWAAQHSRNAAAQIAAPTATLIPTLAAPTAPPTATPPRPGPPQQPHLAPSGDVTGTLVLSESLSINEPLTITEPQPATAALLPTPTPTLTLAEGLARPIATPRGGFGGMVVAATATALAQSADPTATDPTATPQPPVVAAAPQLAPTPIPQPTPDGVVRRASVPILMYHYLSVPPADANIYRRDLSVTPDLFAAHLDAMQQAGYTTISLYALHDHLMQGAPLPEKPVVLTFDDGYRDNYINAYPRLHERGMTATFFIVTDFIDLQYPDYLTWDMVREMYAGGMSIEAHGRNHVSLANKDDAYLVWQALGSLETIQYELGVRPRFISYPAGEYDQRTIDIFRSAHYWAGFTTQQGATHRSDDPFQLRRVRVRGTTTTDELLRLLALDW